MSDLVGNPEDRFSRVAAQVLKTMFCLSRDLMYDHVFIGSLHIAWFLVLVYENMPVIMITHPCNLYHLTFHLHKVKQGFRWVYFYFCSKS